MHMFGGRRCQSQAADQGFLIEKRLLKSTVKYRSCYSNQAVIMIKQDYLKEALILLQKREVICLELGNRVLNIC